MKTILAISVLGAELIVAAGGAFFLIATLGFAGEATRQRDLTVFGWALGALYVAVALTPLLSVGWVIYRRFFARAGFPSLELISSPYWVPVVLFLGALLFCAGLLAFQNGAGLRAVARLPR